jgi:hypothetical protein
VIRSFLLSFVLCSSSIAYGIFPSIAYGIFPSIAYGDTEAPPPPPAQGSFAQRPAPGNDADDVNKEIADLSRDAEKVMQQMDQLSKVNPLSVQGVNAVKEKALRLATDDKFLRAAEDLWKNEKRNQMFLVQAGWFLFMLLFKAWRQSRTHHWFKRLLVGGACSLVTWIGLIYVIPLAVLGEPFGVFTGTLWRVLVMG